MHECPECGSTAHRVTITDRSTPAYHALVRKYAAHPDTCVCLICRNVSDEDRRLIQAMRLTLRV